MKKLFIILFFSFCIISLSSNTVISSSKDTKNLSITVYNNNFAVVKEERILNLKSSCGKIKYEDVPSSIEPDSVIIYSDNKSFKILDQNYEYNQINKKALLDNFVGKEITILIKNPYKGTEKKVKAKLVSNNDGPIYEINGKIYLEYPGYQILPYIPENFMVSPSLIWSYSINNSQKVRVTTIYITKDISWKTNYILNLESDNVGMLFAWATITNNSGINFENTNLKLIAGSVNKKNFRKEKYNYLAKGMVGRAVDTNFEQKNIFEYYAFDLNRKVTIKNKQMKQILLLSANNIHYDKKYKVESTGNYCGYYGDKISTLPVKVYIEFKNSKKNNLYKPLPAGVIKVFKKDKGDYIFVGEDSINHTPVNELVSLNVGNAFDVKAKQKQTYYKKLSKELYESSWEVTFINSKKSPIKIEFYQNFYGEWEILSANANYKRITAKRVVFYVKVKPDDNFTLRYTLRTKVGW